MFSKIFDGSDGLANDYNNYVLNNKPCVVFDIKKNGKVHHK